MVQTAKKVQCKMAIFIASTKSISRGKGQSAVASASYRAGVELQDERYGKKHDYTKRSGVMSADIILPTSLKDKDATIDRGTLWNLAEKSENRKDARVAREWLVNLPYELEEEERKQLAHAFSQELADRYNVIADCAIHRPTEKEIERGADPRNFHAHIMLTTRQAELDQEGNITLTDKSLAELSDKKRRSLGLERMSEEVKQVRQIWERVANEKLLEHGHDLIDSRSYAEQGIDILPQLKMGKTATHMERDGKQTLRGEINRAITERNELIFNRELIENDLINDRADQIIFESRKKIDIEHTTPPTTKANVGGAVQFDAVAQALALAKNVKSKRDQEKLEEAKAKAEEVKRLQQQREAEEAKAKAEAMKRAEQARAEEAKRKEAEAQQRKFEKNQFKEAKQEMLAEARANPDNFKINNIETDSRTAKAVITIKVASEYMQSLNAYIDDPVNSDYQKRQAVGERDVLIELTAEEARKALTATKELYYTSERKTHTAELQTALNQFADVTSDDVSKAAQRELQDAQKQINDYSNEVNRSYGYGMGR